MIVGVQEDREGDTAGDWRGPARGVVLGAQQPLGPRGTSGAGSAWEPGWLLCRVQGSPRPELQLGKVGTA